ncbi:hypothetical protein MMC25_004920 [Agyrium rufum]|nr:hypothetical protein [Agyrium rufum]
MDSFNEDIMTELARLEHAAATSNCHDDDHEPSPDKISQWQTLFAYSHDQAATKIKQRGADLSRLVIPLSAWEEIREAKEAQGYDKDAYEHFLETRPKMASSATSTLGFCTALMASLTEGTASATYLMKLEDCLSVPLHVQTLCQSHVPLVIESDDDDPTARFCRVSARERNLILAAAVDFPSNRRSSGIESTLPQHRLSSAGEVPRPAQDEYPVWYFFYGNLAKKEILSRRLGVAEEEIWYREAWITGGKMSSWGGRYRALLDGSGGGDGDGNGEGRVEG